jgi:purine nucleosidase
MGGSLRAGGNQTPAAEFNFIADPDAASLVLKAGFPRLGLVPIDVCDDARLLATDIGTLRSLGTPAAEVVLALLQFSTGGGIPAAGVPFYDPTAWLLARQPDLSIWEQHYLVVDAGQGEGRGASIADWRGSARKAPNAQVGMRLADRQAFLHTFFNILEHPRY